MLTEERRRQFEAYLSGALSEEASAALEAELLEDDTLLAMFEDFSMRVPEGEGVVDIVPPPDFTHSVRERIRRRSGGRLFQEDRVTSRYIPMFAIAAFALILLIAVVGRFKPFDALSDEEVEVVEQGTGTPEATDDTGATRSPLETGRRVLDRPNRAVYDDEQAMVPASAGIRYQDLPVSGKPTPTQVTYTKRVMLLESPRTAAELRAEIEEIFGEREITEQDGYLRLSVRERDLSGAIQRLQQMEGVFKEESRRLPLEEMESTYIRFYYDMPQGQP